MTLWCLVGPLFRLQYMTTGAFMLVDTAGQMYHVNFRVRLE
jgi:hypothetical protein